MLQAQEHKKEKNLPTDKGKATVPVPTQNYLLYRVCIDSAG